MNIAEDAPIDLIKDSKIIEKIADAAIRVGSRVFDRAKVGLQVGFTSYLEKSYKRCRYYKTILNPYEPSDLEETYISVQLRHLSKSEYVEDRELTTKFIDGHRCVVTGLAGCGKSMFMRNATLRAFESKYCLPLFIELRKFNESRSKELILFAYNECTSSQSNVTIAQFKVALKSGLFALILDGFDEIEFDLRRLVSEQIQNLAEDYEKCPIIISGRPDRDIFSAWEQFDVYEVEKFDKRQTVELVKSVKYDSGVKERFLKALEDRLFKSHEDFLKSPLLTIIMLLTYEEFGEIPNKMHAFYSRAFDTLFQKHDADKEQFVRKIKTNLSREDFRTILSAFCAMTYAEEKFTFSRDSLNKFVNKAIEYTKNSIPNLDVRASNFIDDLRDAVCLVQEEGMEFVFVHRSFQEYFTAVFAGHLSGAQAKKILDKLSSRFNDNAVPMAIDLNREKVELHWVIPTIDKYISLFGPRSGRRSTANVFRQILGDVGIYAMERADSKETSLAFAFRNLPSDQIGPLEIICREYRHHLGPVFMLRSIDGMTMNDAKRRLMDESNSKKKSYRNLAEIFSNLDDGRFIIKYFSLSSRDSWWLDELGFSETFDLIHERLKIVKDEISARSNRRDDIFDQIVG